MMMDILPAYGKDLYTANGMSVKGEDLYNRSGREMKALLRQFKRSAWLMPMHDT